MMFINNYVPPKPPEEVLNRCHLVTIGDPKTPFWQMKQWCRENDLSMLWAELVDTVDIHVGPPFDQVAGFYFIDEPDATAFTLKFK